MTKRVDLPDEVRSEVLLPAKGETVYWLSLPDEQIELLAMGFCSEIVAREAFAMLRWKRDLYKAEAQTRNREIA